MNEKRGKGHPRSFESAEDFMNKFDEYLEHCEIHEKLANIAGFCGYCRISRETFYKQREYYSDTFKVIQARLEDAALNHTSASMGIFYLKNKFGYVDKVETINQNINREMTEEEAEAILKKEGIEV